MQAVYHGPYGGKPRIDILCEQGHRETRVAPGAEFSCNFDINSLSKIPEFGPIDRRDDLLKRRFWYNFDPNNSFTFNADVAISIGGI